jgi:hypothetical protein
LERDLYSTIELNIKDDYGEVKSFPKKLLP